jgi:hypothetical protein
VLLHANSHKCRRQRSSPTLQPHRISGLERYFGQLKADQSGSIIQEAVTLDQGKAIIIIPKSSHSSWYMLANSFYSKVGCHLPHAKSCNNNFYICMQVRFTMHPPHCISYQKLVGTTSFMPTHKLARHPKWQL